MQPPAGLDISAIKEALARRAQGAAGAPAGGATAPAVAQQSQPGGLTPTGNPNTPGTPVPGVSPPAGAQAPQAPGGARPSAPKPQANFDDETKNVGKVLITQLLKYL